MRFDELVWQKNPPSASVNAGYLAYVEREDQLYAILADEEIYTSLDLVPESRFFIYKAGWLAKPELLDRADLHLWLVAAAPLVASKTYINTFGVSGEIAFQATDGRLKQLWRTTPPKHSLTVKGVFPRE